jgi:uncharacterized membrane protein
MDVTLILLRIVHVLAGVFWVGTMVFLALLLLPSIRDAGPDGGKVMAALAERRFMQILPAVAILSMLSGIWLYWRVSFGFDSAYMRSGSGMTYGIGAASTIVAFVIGVAIVRPAMQKGMSLSQAAMKPDASQRESLMAEAQRLRRRADRTGLVVAGLLGIAALAMAVGRYV